MVDEYVRCYLAPRAGVDTCDACLGNALGISTPTAATAAERLGRDPLVLRDRWRCAICGRVAWVTRALAVSRRRLAGPRTRLVDARRAA